MAYMKSEGQEHDWNEKASGYGLLYYGDYLVIDEIKGPWVSLGVHLDFQNKFIDIHFIWWIITIGRPYHRRNNA